MTLHSMLLSDFSEFVSARIGLHFPKERWGDLERGISSAAGEFGFSDVEACIRWLVSSSLSRKQIEILASYLTVGETYFFRERKDFEALEKHILPGLIQSRRKTEKYLRIWSAGCSTGEEPYSIAILLSNIIPDIKEWNVTIIATDINPNFLRKASLGIYSEWSFRDNPPWVRDLYFNKENNHFEIRPDIRKMVTFFYHNLADDAYPSLLNNTNAMDIIFCRNVLMYFSPKLIKHVVGNFYHCLLEGGWLIVSPVETSHKVYSQYLTVNFADAILYKKHASMSMEKEHISNDVLYHIGAKVSQRKPAYHVPLPPEPQINSQAQKGKPVELYKEALALYENGKYGDAAEKIAGLFSHDHDSKAMVLLAKVYANEGKLAEALKWCEKAIGTDRLNPHYYYLRAMILQERGEFEEAVKSLKRAIYLDPDFVLAHFAMGNLSRRLGKSKESDRYFENVSMLLRRFKPEQILQESDGITAGRFSEIIDSGKRKRGYL